ncbi:MAG: histidine phosphatase family protein [Actinomycetia bacterium]|nr:histidine phosphatase family protein [Actinomycetes bacterium]
MAQVEGIIGGPKGCKGLSDLGREQVALLRDRWRRTGQRADVLLSSTLPRAVESAELLSEVLGVPVEQDEGLCEIAPGECDGMSWADFDHLFRGEDYRWSPHTAMAEGGEAWVDFMARVSRTLAGIVERHEGKVIVAAVHGGVIDGSMVHFLGLPNDAGNVLATTNSSVTEWSHGEHPWAPAGGWRLLRFNDAAHLE